MSLTACGVSFGCDPEFFFTDKKTGKIVGSEKILPELGTGRPNNFNIVRDGVQGEIAGLGVSSCRETVSSFLNSAFNHLRTVLQAKGDYSVTFQSVVDVEKEELESLSPKSRVFGCAPSRNVYNMTAEVGINGETYYKRAAGGHIHMGSLPRQIYCDHKVNPALRSYPEADHRQRLIAIMDVLVGNTCVLIDRDPGQVERRKYYGRAGEHRLPKHGVEYRVLSNFWLKDYVLYSFVMNLGRMSVSVLYNTILSMDPSYKGTFADMEKFLLENVDFDKVIKAINTNDAELAKENFEHVRKFVVDHVVDYKSVNDQSYAPFPLIPSFLPKFDKFVKDVETRGLDKIFPGDPLQKWADLDRAMGWEKFIARNY